MPEEPQTTVASVLERLDSRIENHSKRLNNDMEIIGAQTVLIDALIIDVKALRAKLNEQGKAIEELKAMLLPKAVN